MLIVIQIKTDKNQNSSQIFHSSNKRLHLCLVGKRKLQSYNNSKKKTSYFLEKFYYFKYFSYLKVGAPGTFEMLGTFAHGSAFVQRGPRPPVSFCTTLCMRVMKKAAILEYREWS